MPRILLSKQTKDLTQRDCGEEETERMSRIKKEVQKEMNMVWSRSRRRRNVKKLTGLLVCLCLVVELTSDWCEIH